MLRPAAAIRLGRSDGRISVSSDEIGLASFNSGWPPPKSLACASGMNDQVTASLKPREASARLAASMRFCSVLRTGRAIGYWALHGSERNIIEADNAADLFHQVRLATNVRAPGGNGTCKPFLHIG